MLIKIIIILLISIAITIALTLVRIHNFELATRLYIVFLIISIIVIWLFTAHNIGLEDHTEGFKTATMSEGNWVLFAIPGAIIIGIAEAIARKFFDKD